MGNPYIGELRLFAGNFAPRDWAFCDGRILSISQFDALFNLLGTTYGGNGTTTFQLPDLRGRIPIHAGTDPSGIQYVLGQSAGTESVTLLQSQLPQHSHIVMGASTGGSANPTGNTYGSGQLLFSSSTPSVAMNPNMVLPVGGSQPHENRMPFQCINYIIALYGAFPSRN
jgi:microcystin-dependent protein